MSTVIRPHYCAVISVILQRRPSLPSSTPGGPSTWDLLWRLWSVASECVCLCCVLWSQHYSSCGRNPSPLPSLLSLKYTVGARQQVSQIIEGDVPTVDLQMLVLSISTPAELIVMKAGVETGDPPIVCKYSRITNKKTRWLEALPTSQHSSWSVCFLIKPRKLNQPTPSYKLVILEECEICQPACCTFFLALWRILIPLDKSNKPPISLNIQEGIPNNPITLPGREEEEKTELWGSLFFMWVRGERTCDLIPMDHFSPWWSLDGMFCRRSFFTGVNCVEYILHSVLNIYRDLCLETNWTISKCFEIKCSGSCSCRPPPTPIIHWYISLQWTHYFQLIGWRHLKVWPPRQLEGRHNTRQIGAS